MLQMDWLTNHMDKSDQMAEWLHREFSYEFAQQSLASWQQEFAAGQHDGRWKCLIAMDTTSCSAALHWPATTCLTGQSWAHGWRVCSSPQRLDAEGLQRS